MQASFSCHLEYPCIIPGAYRYKIIDFVGGVMEYLDPLVQIFLKYLCHFRTIHPQKDLLACKSSHESKYA